MLDREPLDAPYAIMHPFSNQRLCKGSVLCTCSAIDEHYIQKMVLSAPYIVKDKLLRITQADTY